MKTVQVYSDWAQVSDDAYGNKRVKICVEGKILESVVDKDNCLVPNGIHNGVSAVIDKYKSAHGLKYESIHKLEIDV